MILEMFDRSRSVETLKFQHARNQEQAGSRGFFFFFYLRAVVLVAAAVHSGKHSQTLGTGHRYEALGVAGVRPAA